MTGHRIVKVLHNGKDWYVCRKCLRYYRQEDTPVEYKPRLHLPTSTHLCKQDADRQSPNLDTGFVNSALAVYNPRKGRVIYTLRR